MKQKQDEQLVYKAILHTQLSQTADIVEEMLFDDEIMFGEELNRKLTEWLMSTEEIRNDLAETANKGIEAFED